MAKGTDSKMFGACCPASIRMVNKKSENTGRKTTACSCSKIDEYPHETTEATVDPFFSSLGTNTQNFSEGTHLWTKRTMVVYPSQTAWNEGTHSQCHSKSFSFRDRP